MNITIHWVEGSDDIDYLSLLPVYLLPSAKFSGKSAKMCELNTMDACAIAYMSSLLANMQLRDTSAMRPPFGPGEGDLPWVAPYTCHDATGSLRARVAIITLMISPCHRNVGCATKLLGLVIVGYPKSYNHLHP